MISNFVEFGGCPFIVLFSFYYSDLFIHSVRLFSEERTSREFSEWGGLRESQGREGQDQNILHEKKKVFQFFLKKKSSRLMFA